MINEKVIKDKLDFYKGKNKKVHVTKSNKEWLNCYIISEENPNIYLIREDRLGIMHLFLGEIFDIEEYREDSK